MARTRAGRALAALGNPLSSEAAAFRWLLAMLAICALIAVVVLAVRAAT